MTTFSQLVDEMVRETRRPDMAVDIATYLNQTLRELHFKQDSNAAIAFKENLVEDLLTATVETGFGWEIPDPTIFQLMAAVRYDSIFTNTPLERYVPEKHVGRGLAGVDKYFYRAGGSYYFAGYGGLNARIAIAYYQYTRRLKYFAAGQRPAEYDDNLGWTYAPQFDTAELRPAAQAYSTNWILMRWSDVVSEGVRAKVYKRLSDDARARTCYSLYSGLRQGLFTSESVTLAGFS